MSSNQFSQSVLEHFLQSLNQRLVATTALLFAERMAGRAISDADVTQSPFKLSDRIGSPIHRDDLHLVGR